MRLRQAAGKVALPDRLDRRKHSRARRQKKKVTKRVQDDMALEATSNRAMKRALAFPTAPKSIDLNAEHRALLERQAGERPKDARVRHL